MDNTPFQTPDSIHHTGYLAINLIWNPAARLWTGIKYLYGSRTELNGDAGGANRLQIAFLY